MQGRIRERRLQNRAVGTGAEEERRSLATYTLPWVNRAAGELQGSTGPTAALLEASLKSLEADCGRREAELSSPCHSRHQQGDTGEQPDSKQKNK